MYGEEFAEGEPVQEEGEQLLREAMGKHCRVVIAINLKSEIEHLVCTCFCLPQFLYHSGKGRLFGIEQRQNRLNCLTSTCKKKSCCFLNQKSVFGIYCIISSFSLQAMFMCI